MLSALRRHGKKKTKEPEKEQSINWKPPPAEDWIDEVAESLRKRFFAVKERGKGHTMLLFGPTSHGKSSIANGCMAALEDTSRPPTYHYVGQSDGSVTSAFRVKEYGPHKIIDMPGIFEGKALKTEDIRKIVTGEVPWVSKMTQNLETSDKRKPIDNTVECIIIILRYDSELPPEIKRQIGVIQDLSGKGEVACHLVLTHLDVCDPQFKDTRNLPNVVDSPKVQNAVAEMSKKTGIPPYNISFVKNYTAASRTDLNSKLQYLFLLDTVKEAADHQVEARTTKAEMAEKYESNVFLESYCTNNEIVYFVVIIIIAVIGFYLIHFTYEM